MSKARKIVCLVMPAYLLFYLFHGFAFLNVYMDEASYFAVFLAFIIILAYIPRGLKENSKIPWYDLVLMASGVAGFVYIAVSYNQLFVRMGNPNSFDMFFSMLALISLLEATRRYCGMGLTIVSGFFLLHPMIASFMPGIFYGRGWPLERVVGLLFMGKDGIFGIATSLAASTIFAFVMFGAMVVAVGMGEWLAKTAESFFGGIQGGISKACIVASAMFGAINGSPASNASVTGSVTIPLMKKAGFSAETAAAIEAVASTGGSVLPPVMGIVAFVMAEGLALPYGVIALAGLLPGILYYLFVYWQVDARIKTLGLESLSAAERMPVRLINVWNCIKEGWYYLIPVVFLVVLLLGFWYPPTSAALYSTILLLVISLLLNSKTKNNLKSVVQMVVATLRRTSEDMVMIALPCAVSGIIIGSIATTGLGIRLSQLISASQNEYVIIFVTAIASLVMGMGLPILPAYMVLATLIAPALAGFGVPMLVGHFLIMYYANFSFITPPVAPALYVTSGIAGSNLWRAGVEAVKLGFMAYFLPLFFWRFPGLLFLGTTWEILYALVVVLVGGLGGLILLGIFRKGKTNSISRILSGVGVVGLLMPLPWMVSTSMLLIIAMLIGSLIWPCLLYKNSSVERKSGNSLPV